MLRESYTAKRMQSVAERAKADYYRTRGADDAAELGDVNCEYIGAVQEDGSYDSNAPIQATSKISFRWGVDFNGLQEAFVEARLQSSH